MADHDQRLIYVPHLRAKDVRALAKAVKASPARIQLFKSGAVGDAGGDGGGEGAA